MTPPPTAGGLAVVMVTWNSQAIIGAALAALPAALAGVPHHRTIVVDNASSDATTAIVRRASPPVTLVQTGCNAGFAAGCNAGIREAGPGVDAVLLLNADVRPAPGSVQRLLKPLTTRNDVGIVVPRLTDAEGELSHSLRRDPTVRRMLGAALLGGTRAARHPALGEAVTDERRYTEPGPVDWATGAAMLLGPRCLREVGPLDESFFLYSEEVELAQRTRERGLHVWYEPAAVMVHDGGAVHHDPHLWALCATNRVRLYARRHGRANTGAFWAAAAANELLRLPRDRTHAAALRALCSPAWMRGGRATVEVTP